METEIVTLFIIGSVQLTFPPNQQEEIQVRSSSVAFCRVFNLKFNKIHLTHVILKLWVVFGQKIIDVPVRGIEPRCFLAGSTKLFQSYDT